MQKQPLKKISALAIAGFFGFSAGQMVLAAAPAALKLESDRTTLSTAPNDLGAKISLSVIDAAGNRTTTANDVTVSVKGGGVFGANTLSTSLPKGFSAGSFPVGGKDGFYKANGAGKATLQAAFASPTSLQSNVLELNFVSPEAECDGMEIDDTDLNISSSSDPNSRAKVVGGTSVDDGNAACHSNVKPGQKAFTKFKLKIAPRHVGKGARTFLLLYVQKPGQAQGRFFDLGRLQYLDLKPGMMGTIGSWGGLGRAGDFAQLPPEIDLFDFDAQTQMMFYGNKFVDFNFPAGTNLMWVGGYTLKGTSKAYFGITSLTIE